MYIQTSSESQNDCLNLRFMKDIHVVGRKMARNCRKTTIYQLQILGIRLYVQFYLCYYTNYSANVITQIIRLLCESSGSSKHQKMRSSESFSDSLLLVQAQSTPLDWYWQTVSQKLTLQHFYSPVHAMVFPILHQSKETSRELKGNEGAFFTHHFDENYSCIIEKNCSCSKTACLRTACLGTACLEIEAFTNKISNDFPKNFLPENCLPENCLPKICLFWNYLPENCLHGTCLHENCLPETFLKNPKKFLIGKLPV